MPRTKILILLGPTGAGKTAASLHLARTFGGGVVNFDSRQVYRDFPLITAQPSPEEQAVCPHRLFGFLGCDETISAGAFADMAAAAIDETVADGLVPILVGGTGLYVRTLLEGIAPIPNIPADIHDKWERECAVRGSASLHEQLASIDPDSAERIHPNDRQRITRALEVHEGTGHTLTWWHEQPVPEPRFDALKIGIEVPIKDLEPILAKRIDLMLEAGALDEARSAYKSCPDADAPGWSGIGCAELFRHLCGQWPQEVARQEWYANTRAYAKRQYTWFRRDPGIIWHPPHALDAIAADAARFLSADT